MSNLASAPLLCSLTTALITLLLLNTGQLQRSIHYIGAVLYLSVTIYLNWKVQQHGILFLDLGGYPAGFAISFTIDYFSSLMLLITALTTFAVSIYCSSDSSIAVKQAFYPTFWFMITGITGAFSTSDLFNLYVWFEVMIIASFVLMTLTREKNSLQGALHYIALNLLATLIMLLAIGILYGLSGTLNIAQLAIWSHSLTTMKFFLPPFAALMIAFAVKSALFPYYFWLPASYHLTSVSAGGIFAGLLTKVGVYTLIRFTTLFLPPHSPLMPILLVLSCLTMLGGVFGAVSDYHLRRILSFHIISQVGYMTLGLAMGTALALTAALFYIIHHIIVKTNLFLIAGLLTRYSTHVDLRQMGGFFQQKPMLVILFFIPAFSLAGLPPFSGFWAKYLLLQAAFTSGFWLSALIALLVGFFTLFSMIKIWRFAILQPTTNQMSPINYHDCLYLYSPIIFLGTLTLLIGFYPQILYGAVEQAAQALLNPHCYLQALSGEAICQP
ncbi:MULTISPECIES: proton-conducting transporter membrane subunit [unclassified Legionella]|uniref:proton-conducting transporter transmembrane domain-containing protein n=1 Tax=unclassified Legionella TaxID=2622702 RepID=UPI0010554867|nr:MULTISPECIES: proton-conducting transporter membrane subunit [unclassified Legionella]MDI9819422.1 proton-conducting transporter membrane subunit [Legionella sp. PL877]